VSAGVGYTNVSEDRTFRIFESSSENTFRLVGDAVSTKYASLRTKYEHSVRTGTIDDEVLRDMAGCPPAPAVCNDSVATAEHVGMRHFDIADRNRDRFTFLGSTTPIGTTSFRGSITYGKDNYPNSDFGLQNYKQNIYAVGFDMVPNDQASFGLTYNFERYEGLSDSRTANPTPDPGFADPNRNWSTSSLDKVHSVIANVAYTMGKTDVRFWWDYNKSTSTYTYAAGPALPVPQQLSPVLSSLNDITFDLTRSISTHVGVGFSYWYEKYTVDDFALDPQAIPRLDMPSALLIGYAYQPYTAQTFWGRIFYKW
jgi:hypothetical protein